jgi:hypothetical protein
MSDIIYYKNGEETFRISPSTVGTKCPETKLEIKMTETDISKVLIEGDYATIMGVKYKRVEEQKITLELTLEELHMLDKYVEYCEETKEFFDKLKNAYPKHKSPAEEAYKRCYGEYPSGTPSENARWDAFLRGYQATQPHAVPVDEPEYYDEVEWDEKDNPASYITDEVVNRLIKQHQAQKLYNRLYDELGYDFDACNDVVDLVEDWLPKEQSAEGSQNVDTELLVDGFNHCLEKIKGMLR